MLASNFFRLHVISSGLLALLLSSSVYGQISPYRNPYVSRLQQPKSVTTPAMEFFGRSHPRATALQHARQLLPAPQPVLAAGAKPFNTLQRGDTLTPYLGLDLFSSESSIPNYHAFVRPRQQQQLANKAQAAQVRRLKQQLRVATAQGIVSNNPSGGVPTTGHSAQFLNMGGYYPAPR